MDYRRYADVGGTSGGLGHFLIGFAMACIGGYLLTSHVNVHSSYWNFYGANSFGVTLIPMLFGIAIVFFKGKSPLGWLLIIGGALFILAGVIMNMQIYFTPTSLFQTIVMLVLLVGGLALIVRAIHPRRGDV
jgi:hypothetical protein